jgi:hypothetical protein
MKYEIELENRVERQIESWDLPEHILDTLERLLDEQLASDPMTYVFKVVTPAIAYQYNCSIIEDSDPPRAHVFIFRVRFGPSEKSLIIWNAIYYKMPPG